MLVDLQTVRTSSAKNFLAFNKAELNAILSIYSYQVAKGTWRDYAMDFLKDMAVFSIFRHSAEQPLAAIVKIPGNTSSGYIYECFFEKKRLSRTPELGTALQALRDIL